MERIYAAVISVFRTIGYDEETLYSIVELFTDRTEAYYWMHDRMESEESRYGGPHNCHISGNIDSYQIDDIKDFQDDLKIIRQDREIQEARRKKAAKGGGSA
tara:strand:+ start:996 stop:1301 length:306 start_codon:yes stop_codon:yes gene_type:complete